MWKPSLYQGCCGCSKPLLFCDRLLLRRNNNPAWFNTRHYLPHFKYFKRLMGYWFGVPTGACIVMVAQIFYFGVLRAVMPLSDLKPLMFEMPWTILLLRRLRLAHFPPNVKAAVTGFMYSVPCTSR